MCLCENKGLRRWERADSTSQGHMTLSPQNETRVHWDKNSTRHNVMSISPVPHSGQVGCQTQFSPHLVCSCFGLLTVWFMAVGGLIVLGEWLSAQGQHRDTWGQWRGIFLSIKISSFFFFFFFLTFTKISFLFHESQFLGFPCFLFRDVKYSCDYK